MQLKKVSSSELQKRTRVAHHMSLLSPDEEAILITLLYSDIFAFPLRKDELWNYLISKQPITKKQFTAGLRFLEPYIKKVNGYYMLKDGAANPVKRELLTGEVTKKYALAQRAASILRHIPTIQFIGISGGLAAQNVTKEDDIDLFIIVKKNTIFTTRFLILFVLQVVRLRRSRKQMHTADTICANLLIDTHALSWPTIKQNVYTAREIAQIQPLFNREKTFEHFLAANEWVPSYLPNALKRTTFIPFTASQSFQNKTISSLISLLPVELLMSALQRTLMKPHRTTETVTNHLLAFHPNDYGVQTMRALKLKMRQLGLLTKI